MRRLHGALASRTRRSPTTSTRMPQLTTSLLQRYGDKWTLLARHQRPLLRLHGARRSPPPASTATARPTTSPAGDGSESRLPAHPRRQYQAATVPEPLTMQGWQLVDELNRAFAGEKWSGYVSPRAPRDHGQHRLRRRPEERLRPRQRLSRRLQEDLGRSIDARHAGHRRMRRRIRPGNRPRRRLRNLHRVSTVRPSPRPCRAWRDLRRRSLDLNIGISAYLLTFGVLIPANGWIASRLGGRSTFSLAVAIFVLSLSFNGSQNVLLEVLMTGKAVVSFDCPGGLPKSSTRKRDYPLVPPEANGGAGSVTTGAASWLEASGLT